MAQSYPCKRALRLGLVASGLFLLFSPSVSAAAVDVAPPAPGAHTPTRPAPHVSRARFGEVPFEAEPGAAMARRDGGGDARFTFYEAGLGACGGVNVGSDFIVALNSQQFGGGSHCYEMITISYGGKTTQAQIVDECPGCPYGGLDLSEGLFSSLANTDEGVIYGKWNFGGAAKVSEAAAAQPKPERKPDPKPEYKASPKPDPKPVHEPERKPDPKPETKPQPQLKLKPKPKPKPDPKPALKAEHKPVHEPTKTLRVDGDVAAHETRAGAAHTDSASKAKTSASVSSSTTPPHTSGTASTASETGSAALASDAVQRTPQMTTTTDANSPADSTAPAAQGETTSEDDLDRDADASSVVQNVPTGAAPSVAAVQGVAFTEGAAAAGHGIPFAQGAATSRSSAVGMQKFNWAFISVGLFISIVL